MDSRETTPASRTKGSPESTSKTLLPFEPTRQPSWPMWVLMKGTRLLLLTVLWSGVGMGLGLFGGIVVLMTAGILRHHLPPMDLAYRQGAIPVAIIVGSCAFVWNLVRIVQAGVRRRTDHARLPGSRGTG